MADLTLIKRLTFSSSSLSEMLQMKKLLLLQQSCVWTKWKVQELFHVHIH